ncbi:MAG: hypothetical protein PVH12_01130 [Candidatus Bathyarchaeota archaeon]|jgi:hypothetical protein
MVLITLVFSQILIEVHKLYVVWIKIDEILPWIELEGKYRTKKEARRITKDNLNEIQMKIVNIPEKKRK